MESWLSVPGYEGFYEVSDFGRVRSLPRKTRNGCPGRILKPGLSSGHLTVALSIDRQKKSFLVHRLVVLAFIGPPPSPEYEVCHNDGDPLNNTLDNLRWGTRSDNLLDSVRHGTHVWASRVYCPQGHPYNEENTATGRRGNGKTFRVCRICSREAKRRYEDR